MVASIALPRLMRVGAGASRLLPEVLGQLGLSRPFVVTDPYLAGSGRVEALLERLASAGTRATVFADTVPDPTVASV
ncbi:iron-containing alcohol dehydrogenase, partial [Methylobacterium sp. J-026]|uniref:iron-containing alcohol dehydrogenase n=1 Tax=Methylobacterium sp. J-026 TaxID=2836624 RepID=UPI001FBAADCF